MFKRIKQILKENKNKRIIFQKLADYLCPGEYVFDNSLTYIYPKSNPKMSKLLDNTYTKIMRQRTWFRKLAAFLVRLFLFHPISIEEKNQPIFQGNIFLIGLNGKEHKVFDLANKKVLLLYPTKQAYWKKLRYYEQFSSYFPMPAILANNDNDLFIVEEFVPAKQTDQWNDSDYLDVIADYFRNKTCYLKECERKKEYELKSINELVKSINKESPFANYLVSKMSLSAVEMKLPFVKLHGDLWSSNILIDKNHPQRIYYIDWEKSCSFVFFYDFFFLILNECSIKSNYLFAEKYMSGEYDEMAARMLQVFGMNFDQENRLDYLYITLLNQYIERWSAKDKKNELKMLKRWSTILDKITLLGQNAIS